MRVCLCCNTLSSRKVDVPPGNRNGPHVAHRHRSRVKKRCAAPSIHGRGHGIYQRDQDNDVLCFRKSPLGTFPHHVFFSSKTVKQAQEHCVDAQCRSSEAQLSCRLRIIAFHLAPLSQSTRITKKQQQHHVAHKPKDALPHSIQINPCALNAMHAAVSWVRSPSSISSENERHNIHSDTYTRAPTKKV